MFRKPKTHVVRFRQEDRPLFLAVKSGRKSIETRSATKAHLNLLPGDFLKCVCDNNVVIKKITKVTYFPSIEALFKEVPVSRVMPDIKTLEEAKKWYGKFPGHLEKIAKFGLVAFFLEN